MKKLLLSLSVVLSLFVISSPSHAKTNPWANAWANTAIKLAWTQSDTFFIYCGYQIYRADTGYLISSYSKQLPRWVYSSCPAA
ncbi:hypothetical protein RHO15_05995 [Utexia brackfieldae]|uniref:hypothetical protein n=1 Tax=Utexia brackfieldae TaxID=3074108 RepID=UPI00370D113D